MLFSLTRSTPEFKLFLDQCSVLGSRMMDAAASGRNKQLLHNVTETVWSCVELMSDPNTILALAEVTATLCHTLEMEEALYRRTSNSSLSSQQRRQRRQERNQFTQQAYATPDLMKHYDATVEQVIMSGLVVGDGGGGGDGGGVADSTCDDCHSSSNRSGPPKSVAFEQHQPTTTATATPSNESAESISVKEQWKKAGRDKVDSVYLEQKIASRSEQMEQERNKRNRMSKFSVVHGTSERQQQSGQQMDSEQLRNDIENLTVESVADDKDDNSDRASRSALQRQETVRIKNGSSTTSTGPKQPVVYSEGQDSANDHVDGNETPILPSPLVETDSAMSRFYRTLDDVLTRKRAETMLHLEDRGSANSKRGDALYQTVATMNAISKISKVGGKKKGKDTVAARLHRWRRAAQDGDAKSKQTFVGTPQQALKKHLSLVILAALASSFLLLWFGFGCYGIYVFVKARFASRVVPPAVATISQEIIIRIVKEVVHVNQHGAAIHDGGILEAAVNPDLLAKCVSAAVGQG